MPEIALIIVVFAAAAFVAMILLASAIQIVPEYQRLAVFRLGRYVHTAGPGVALLLPIIDRGFRVDLREQSANLTQVISTGDFLRVSVDFGWRYRVADPAKWALEGQGNLEAEFREIAESTLRPAVGALTADQLRFERAAIGETVRARMQTVAEARGVTVTQAEIREIARA